MFKNVMVYRLGTSALPLEQAEAAVTGARFVECTATQDKSVGWVEPRGQAHGPLIESVQGHWILKLMIESKSVPGHLVRRKADEEAASIEAQTGRRPGKKQMRELRDDVLLSLLPQAFAKQSTVWVWLDWAKQRLVLDAGSQAKADEALAMLMKCLPQLNMTLVQTTQSPQAAMTGWLLSAEPDVPELASFHIEREGVLKAMAEEVSSIRYTRHPLRNDEVRHHVQTGMLPTQLALSWDGRVGFTLTESLQLKKVKFLDGDPDATLPETSDERFDADVALSTGMLSPLLDALIEVLGGELQT